MAMQELLEYPRGDAQFSAGRSVAIYGDRLHVRSDLASDLEDAGVGIAHQSDLAALLDESLAISARVAFVDCPSASGLTLAVLSRIDQHAAWRGMPLVVSTQLGALEAVFGCLDQSRATILVDATRGERVIAIGRLLAEAASMAVREPVAEEEISLLRLSEQVSEIARKLDSMDPRNDRSLRSPSSDYSSDYDGPDAEGGTGRLGRRRAALPDARLVRQIIRQRQARKRFFDGDLFADPAWDILLDLTAARVERERVSITSLCIASGVPPTTALRWITQMVETGLLKRVEDESDKRRAFIELSDRAVDAMARYFADIGKDAGRLV